MAYAGSWTTVPQDPPARADWAEAEKMPGIYDYLEAVLPDSGWLVEERTA